MALADQIVALDALIDAYLAGEKAEQVSVDGISIRNPSLQQLMDIRARLQARANAASSGRRRVRVEFGG